MATIKMEPCGEPAPKTYLNPVGHGIKLGKPILCNRPCGHEGNHSYSTMIQARLWEWDHKTMLREVS